jgi:hypothetical protein
MIGFSEKSSRTAAYLLFVILFVTYVLNADSVYYALSGKSHAVKLPHDILLHAKGDLQFLHGGDHSLVNNQFEEGKVFRGRSIRVANASGKAQLRVFIRSTDALYEVIENRRSFWAQSRKRVVNFFISTSGLEDGIYQLGLYLSDDEGVRVAWTDSFFERVDGGPVDYMARPVAPVPARISEDLKFSIERLGKAKESIVFRGWAVLENIEMNDYNAYIKIEDSHGVSKTFYAPLYTRMDIASMYDDPRAANSGFRIKVPRGEFAPGNHAIKVVVKHRKTGETVESVQTETKNF